MIFYTINKFIPEILAFNSDVKNVIIAYLTKDSRIDKFEHNTVLPLLLILETENDKIRMNYDEIVEHFGESIALTLPKENIDKLGVAVCSINTETQISNKFGVEYYKRQFLLPGPKIIKEVKDINTKKEEEKPKVYDL